MAAEQSGTRRQQRPWRTGIVRFLSDDERKALLAACKASADPNIYTAVMLALATGARYSNIRELTWADVDLDQWRLRFQRTKNDQPRFVPLVGPAQAVLQAHFDRDPTQKEWVFKGGRDDVPADLDRPWRAVRAAAGLVGEKHCRFHDLRHTTASYLTMNGATLAEVAEALGQRTLVMAKRYSHQIRGARPRDVRADGGPFSRGRQMTIRFLVSDESYAASARAQKAYINEAADRIARGDSLDGMDTRFLAAVLRHAADQIAEQQPRPRGHQPEVDPADWLCVLQP